MDPRRAEQDQSGADVSHSRRNKVWGRGQTDTSTGPINFSQRLQITEKYETLVYQGKTSGLKSSYSIV